MLSLSILIGQSGGAYRSGAQLEAERLSVAQARYLIAGGGAAMQLAATFGALESAHIAARLQAEHAEAYAAHQAWVAARAAARANGAGASAAPIGLSVEPMPELPEMTLSVAERQHLYRQAEKIVGQQVRDAMQRARGLADGAGGVAAFCHAPTATGGAGGGGALGGGCPACVPPQERGPLDKRFVREHNKWRRRWREILRELVREYPVGGHPNRQLARAWRRAKLLANPLVQERLRAAQPPVGLQFWLGEYPFSRVATSVTTPTVSQTMSRGALSQEALPPLAWLDGEQLRAATNQNARVSLGAQASLVAGRVMSSAPVAALAQYARFG